MADERQDAVIDGTGTHNDAECAANHQHKHNNADGSAEFRAGG